MTYFLSEEVFFHYTDKEAAIKTVLQGQILPSALAENSNAVHGDSVYLTTLETETRQVITSGTLGPGLGRFWPRSTS